MKRKVITYFALISYLALFIANIFHFHHIVLKKNYYHEVSELNKSVYLASYHSALNCPVQNTFNNLHNFSLFPQQKSAEIFDFNEKQVLIKSDFPKSISFYYNFSFRAPPFLLS